MYTTISKSCGEGVTKKHRACRRDPKARQKKKKKKKKRKTSEWIGAAGACWVDNTNLVPTHQFLTTRETNAPASSPIRPVPTCRRPRRASEHDVPWLLPLPRWLEPLTSRSVLVSVRNQPLTLKAEVRSKGSTNDLRTSLNPTRLHGGQRQSRFSPLMSPQRPVVVLAITLPPQDDAAVWRNTRHARGGCLPLMGVRWAHLTCNEHIGSVCTCIANVQIFVDNWQHSGGTTNHPTHVYAELHSFNKTPHTPEAGA